MKRKTLILSAIISITISFSSCAAFERNRTDSKESTITDGQGMDDISIIRSREYDNMTIAEDFRISYPETEEIGIYDVTCVDDFDKDTDKVFENLITDYDPQKVNKNITNEQPSMSYVTYDDEKCSAFIYALGAIVYLKKSDPPVYVEGGTGTTYLESYITEASGDKSVKVGNTTAAVKDYGKSCKDYIDKLNELVSYHLDIRPFILTTQQLDNGSVAGTMNCRYYYKGIPILNTPLLHKSEGDHHPESQFLSFPFFNFINGTDIYSFSTAYCFKDHSTVKMLEKKMSPAEAIDNISKQLATGMSLDAKYEELIYIPKCINNEEAVERGSEISLDDIVELRPYWAVYFDITPWHEVFALSDYETGEVYFVNNSRR